MGNSQKTKIAFIGARGAGKSKLSRRLKKITGYSVMSTDNLLSYENNGLSIREMVHQIGWKGFRDLEYELLKKLMPMSQVIIDCGGGILIDMVAQKKKDSTRIGTKWSEVYSKRKVNLLKKHCHVVYLKRNWDWYIHRNAQPTPDRPALLGNYEEILKIRLKFYKIAADFIIDMDTHSFEEAAESLYKKYF